MFLVISHKNKILQTEFDVAKYVKKSHKNLGALSTWLTLLPTIEKPIDCPRLWTFCPVV